MPLLTFHVIAGRSQGELTALLDATHDVVVEVFEVPERDRYQLVQEYQPGRFVLQDTGLGIERTDRVVLLQIASRPRGEEAKQSFYRVLAERLQERCGIASSDLIVTIAENTDADWSFGLGRAQFLTGEL